MKYTIRELEAFSVIGQEVELTNYHKRNIQISTQFWRKFNADLKKSYLQIGKTLDLDLNIFTYLNNIMQGRNMKLNRIEIVDYLNYIKLKELLLQLILLMILLTFLEHYQ